MEGDLSNYYPLQLELVTIIRSADTFTGEFRKEVSAYILATLRDLGLGTELGLTELGMAIRSWLFRGTKYAPDERSPPTESDDGTRLSFNGYYSTIRRYALQ